MLLKRTPKREKRVSLKGAVQINRNSYFVYADEGGKTFLNTGKDERIQKYAVKRMLALNPSIKGLLKQYKIKQSHIINTLHACPSGLRGVTQDHLVVRLREFKSHSMQPFSISDILPSSICLYINS